jgi:hypothetical protein
VPATQNPPAAQGEATPFKHMLLAGHVVGTVAPALHTVPLSQMARTLEFLQNEPTGHRDSVVEPVGHHLVKAHAVRVAGDEHTKPAVQLVSEDELRGQCVPSAHGVANPATQYDPAGHVVWTVERAGHTNLSAHCCMVDGVAQ